MIDLVGKKVLITGAGSLIMTPVQEILKQRGAIVDAVYHEHCDLLVWERFDARVCHFRPHYVIHGAGFNGGIQFNKKYPADIYWQTAQMALNVLDVCRTRGVKKVVSILPSCAYAAYENGEPREILYEGELLDGVPHDSVACHGFAKRILLEYSMQINKQHSLPYVCVVLNNCYGPGDRTDLDRTKVVMALVKKFVDAYELRQPYVEVFGTGAARREFLFSEDAAEGIVRTLERYEDPTTPLNIGTGSDITIKELVGKIQRWTNYTGEIRWLTNYGDGQLRKLLSSYRLDEVLEWHPTVSLEEGLVRTIGWYKRSYYRDTNRI